MKSDESDSIANFMKFNPLIWILTGAYTALPIYEDFHINKAN